MITFMVESMENIFDGAPLELHYKELALNKDKVPLSPQKEIYLEREKQGSVLVIIGREQGKIKAYYIGFIAPGLHYSTCLTCITDIFYLDEESRGNGAGFKLFNFVEEELKRRKVQRWFMGLKMHSQLAAEKLFIKIGAEPVEKTYSKWIGD